MASILHSDGLCTLVCYIFDDLVKDQQLKVQGSIDQNEYPSSCKHSTRLCTRYRCAGPEFRHPCRSLWFTLSHDGTDVNFGVINHRTTKPDCHHMDDLVAPTATSAG